MIARRTNPRDTWTPERLEQLTLLWDKGATAATIGRRIGVTKGAVIGKVHRLGLVPRKIVRRAAPPLDPEHAMLAEAATTWAATESIDRKLGEELIAASREVVRCWYRARRTELNCPLGEAIRRLQMLVGRP